MYQVSTLQLLQFLRKLIKYLSLSLSLSLSLAVCLVCPSFSLFLSVSYSVTLSLSSCLSVLFSLSLSLSLSLCPSFSLSRYISARLSLSLCPSVTLFLTVCQYVRLSPSICNSLFLSLKKSRIFPTFDLRKRNNTLRVKFKRLLVQIQTQIRTVRDNGKARQTHLAHCGIITIITTNPSCMGPSSGVIGTSHMQATKVQTWLRKCAS